MCGSNKSAFRATVGAHSVFPNTVERPVARHARCWDSCGISIAGSLSLELCCRMENYAQSADLTNGLSTNTLSSSPYANNKLVT